MPDTYTHTGKQILHGTKHIADAATPEIAQEIIAGLTARASIAAMIDAEAKRMEPRHRFLSITLAKIASNVRAGLDAPCEAAPEGVRARYLDGAQARLATDKEN